ncbi:hypothetical protein KEM60_03059 [Austwickia sp. TVS 96-490-7B]|nr:hypothetical protein [Austwickia sp. TVS 96-490-7B]MBW3086830.1 hypothetical protein [Austwickia sp. TVS 96-490-7B]
MVPSTPAAVLNDLHDLIRTADTGFDPAEWFMTIDEHGEFVVVLPQTYPH